MEESLANGGGGGKGGSHKGQEDNRRCFGCKILTRRNVNVEAVAETFRPIWRTRGNFEMCEGKDNVLLIVSEMEADTEKVV